MPLWLKRMNKEIADRDERIIGLSRTLERKDAQIIQKDESIESMRRHIEVLEGELRGVHTSTGYRYFLKPMWDIIFPI